MIGWGTGYGKLLLFGEHSAVHGFPAIGMALPMSTNVWLGGTPQPNSHPDALDFAIEDWIIHGLPPQHHHAFTDFWQHFLTLMPPGFHQTVAQSSENRQAWIAGDVPFAMGFGSSGALSTAIVQAGMRMIGTEPSSSWLWETANKLEAVFHGPPSGIDTGLAVHGGCQAFHFAHHSRGRRQLPNRTALPSIPVPLLIGAVPRTATTKQLIAQVSRRMKDKPVETHRLLEQLGLCSRHVAAAAEESSLTADILAAQATIAQNILTEIGVSSPVLNTLFDKLATMGALGAKLSGAGGGGAFFAVFRNAEDLGRASDQLRPILNELYPKGGWYLHELLP